MFTVFHNSTTAYANQVMGNFYHIFDGDRLPRGGENFEPTTAVYDIGSSTYSWYNIYCTNIDANTVTSENGQSLRKITSISPTPSASSYEITGLPESRITYILFSLFTPFSSGIFHVNLNVIINGVSSSSYGYQSLLATSTVYSLYRNTTTSIILFHTITANAPSINVSGSGIMKIYKTSGENPIITVNTFGYTDYFKYLQRGTWTLNDSSTITSLKFISDYSNFATGSSIEVWGMA
jgi:hypothetical protein